MAGMDLYAALESEGRTSRSRARGLLVGRTAPVTVENGRLFAPQWDEAYVDIDAVLTTSAFARLSETPMLVFEEDRPKAFAAKVDAAGSILISTGLIELIGFCSLHVTVCGAASFRRAEDLGLLEDHFTQIVANFVDHGWPLGGDVEASTFDAYRTMAIHRDCMLLFVLFHELGHIASGHLDGYWLGSEDFGSLVPDLDTHAHGLEIEADRFACNAIVDPHALFLASTFFSSWTRAQVSRLVRLGRRAHLSATHPLAVNRLHRLSVLLRERRDPDTDGDARGLEADVARCSTMLSHPGRFGLEAIEYSVEDGRARHDRLLARYSALTAPLR